MVSDEQCCALSDHVQNAAKETSSSSMCHQLCYRIGQFCLRAGTPSISNDPSQDIASLRHHVLSSRSHSRESELQAEIERLKDLCRTQQRIITNLSFRQCLEALPGPRPTNYHGIPNLSSTAHWQNFWHSAWAKAQSKGNSTSSSNAEHPFSPLLEFDQQTRKQIQKIGSELYGTLSTNIHHFSGVFTVNGDQWDILQGAILHALTPATTRKSDGSIDWEEERKRFL